MNTATQSPPNGTHLYPRHVRMSLERSRRSGRGFIDAWTVAMGECGVYDPDPIEDDGERFLHWLREVMRSGYLRNDQGRPDVTAYLEDGSHGHTFTPRPPRKHPKCLWGDGCSTRVRSKRFCASHTRVLRRIARELDNRSIEEESGTE